MTLTFDQQAAILRRAAEDKLNQELSKLHSDMEKSRCDECGFSGYTHQEWCPRRDRG